MADNTNSFVGSQTGGVSTLDGSNPTVVNTGLKAVVHMNMTLVGSTAPGLNTSVLTWVDIGDGTGRVNVYAWKPTSSANPTLIASTGTEQFSWVASGN